MGRPHTTTPKPRARTTAGPTIVAGPATRSSYSALRLESVRQRCYSLSLTAVAAPANSVPARIAVL